MKALKLFYFADRIHLQKYGTPICFDKPIYVNMDYGPVNSCVKDISELNQDNLSEESIKEIEKNHYSFIRRSIWKKKNSLFKSGMLS